MNTFEIDGHEITFEKMLSVQSADIPRTTARRFPLGNLEILTDPEDFDTPALFYDTRINRFFAATLNLMADLHAAHLDAEARERQRKAINAARYKAERVGKHGQDAEARHIRRVSELAQERIQKIRSQAQGA